MGRCAKNIAINRINFFFYTCICSKLPYDVEPEQAMKHPEVSSRIEAAMKRLTTATDTFLNSILQSVDKIP